MKNCILCYLVSSFDGITDSLIAAVIFAGGTTLLTLISRWWWILSEKHRGMTGYYVGTAKIVSIFPEEPKFPKVFDVCYRIGYSRLPWRFRIVSYNRIKDSNTGVGIDICRGGWKETDYINLKYSKQRRLVASFGGTILKFSVTDYNHRVLNGTAVGVSKGLFEGKDVVYAVELRLEHSDAVPNWVKLGPEV